MMSSVAESKAMDAAGSPDDVGTPDSGIADGVFVSAEEKARQHEEWKQELIKTEEEIQTLRQVLNAKLRHAGELKRKLGITAWKEFTEDMNKGIVSVKESQAVVGAKEKIGGVFDVINNSDLYQKSTSAVKSMAEKTTTTLGGLGSVISSKFGDMRENPTFKSFEERVSATVGAVKGKVGGSRSSSTQDFDEALKEAEAKRTDETGDGIPVQQPNPETM